MMCMVCAAPNNFETMQISQNGPVDTKYGFCAAGETTFLFSVALKTFEFETPALSNI